MFNVETILNFPLLLQRAMKSPQCSIVEAIVSSTLGSTQGYTLAVTSEISQVKNCLSRRSEAPITFEMCNKIFLRIHNSRDRFALFLSAE